MRLLIIFTFYIFFCHLGAIRAIVFFHIPRSFQRPVFQSLTSEQTSNDDNKWSPFPSFFYTFRHRHLNPFQNFWRDAIKTSTRLPTTKDESKVNDTFDFKADNRTGHMNTKEASTFTPKHPIIKKDMDSSTKLRGLERYGYPYPITFISLRDLKPLLYNGRNRKDTNDILETTSRASHLENHSRAHSSNNTAAGNDTKDSLPLVEGNCFSRHYISRNLYVWTINWASLAMHFTVILLLSIFVTVSIVFCRSCCSHDDRSASPVYKIRPLTV